MTKKIYILGAGASAEDGLPTMGSLISDCFTIHFGGNHIIGSITEEDELNRFKNVFKLMDRWYKTDLEYQMEEYYKLGGIVGLDIFDSKKYKDIIEPFFTQLYEIAFGNMKDTKLNQKDAECLYEDAKFFFYHPICGMQQGWDNYKKFVSSISKNTDSTIITFNYDLLLEEALHETLENQNDLRSLPWDYCFQFNNKYTYTFDGPFKYLKMHGSFNWIYHRDKNVVDLDDVCKKMHAIKDYYEQNAEILLIPPTLNKEISISCLKTIWTVAKQELLKADEVYFIGYSLPKADKDAYNLFKDTLGNREIQKIVIVNSDDNARKKISEIVKFKEIEYHENFKEYLENTSSNN